MALIMAILKKMMIVIISITISEYIEYKCLEIGRFNLVSNGPVVIGAPRLRAVSRLLENPPRERDIRGAKPQVARA